MITPLIGALTVARRQAPPREQAAPTGRHHPHVGTL
jgi:hypothetical protein